MKIKAEFDAVRVLAFGGISAAYANVGVVTANPVKVFKISNNTEGDMYFSLGGAADHMYLAKGSFTLYDLNANRSEKETEYVLPVGTQFMVKQIDAPVSGAVYIECIY